MSRTRARAQTPSETVKVANAQARDCKTMADSGSEAIAVIGNTDLTPSESENNLKNTVKSIAECFCAAWPIMCCFVDVARDQCFALAHEWPCQYR